MEVGLAQVAVNLPSLWYFSKLVKPKSILYKCRSLVGLRSAGSSAGSSSSNGNLLGNSHQLEMQERAIVVTHDYMINSEFHEKDQEDIGV